MLGKRKIGIDIDGCIALMLPDILREAEERFNKVIQPEEVTRFNLVDNGMTRPEVEDIIYDWDVLSALPEIKFAREALEILWEDYEIHLVTARKEDSLLPTSAWVYEHKMKHDYLEISKSNKAKHSEENGINLFVEDRYKNALELAEVCDTVFLISKSYNEGREVPENVIRVDSWKQILGWIYAD